MEWNTASRILCRDTRANGSSWKLGMAVFTGLCIHIFNEEKGIQFRIDIF